MTAVTGVLLVLGVAATTVAATGTLVSPDPRDRLHFGGAATTVGIVTIALAIVLELPGASGPTVVVALLVLLGAPLVSHALARAEHVRERGEWHVEDIAGSS
ncbi:MAG: monovalent cation/H(+) antiporter subunit G [Actinobacteria bacterium]|nr:monovalent cation/H(+) antiporter subunit G [Actinomycetota bacterium]